MEYAPQPSLITTIIEIRTPSQHWLLAHRRLFGNVGLTLKQCWVNVNSLLARRKDYVRRWLFIILKKIIPAQILNPTLMLLLSLFYLQKHSNNNCCDLPYQSRGQNIGRTSKYDLASNLPDMLTVCNKTPCKCQILSQGRFNAGPLSAMLDQE